MSLLRPPGPLIWPLSCSSILSPPERSRPRDGPRLLLPRPATPRTHRNPPFQIQPQVLLPLVRPQIPGVAPHLPLAPCNRLWPCVTSCAWPPLRSCCALCPYGLCIMPVSESTVLSLPKGVRPHSEIPLVPFPRLMHLRFPLPGTVLGGIRRPYDGGVHDGSLTEHQSLGLQVSVDLRQKALPNLYLSRR